MQSYSVVTLLTMVMRICSPIYESVSIRENFGHPCYDMISNKIHVVHII